MPKSTSTTLLIACLFSAASLGMAQQTKTQIKIAPVEQTSPASGQQMYATYCAACHGAKAGGDGPAAKALKIPPTDLTSLSLKNGGVFPTNHIMSVLQLGVENPAHGSSQMPIWGDLFLSLNSPTRSAPAMVRQRIFNLTNYLKQIQR